ncbi:aquaporin-like protein [Melampsora americana]|nr:aquaporin-like protein [Melampsora americana]
MGVLVIWKASIFEGLGSMILIWIIGVASLVFTLEGPVGVASGLAFLYGTAVAIIMYSLKPITGAHINPIITLSQLAIGNTSPFRSISYIFAQMIGAITGGGLVAAALGKNATNLANGGCAIDESSGFTTGQAVALEFMAALVLLTFAHGTGHSLKPNGTQSVYLSPVLYGLSVGLICFCTSGFAPHAGYIGAYGFPNICFGLSFGILRFQSIHWVFWIPGFCAVILHGILYRFLNPYENSDSMNELNAQQNRTVVPGWDLRRSMHHPVNTVNTTHV